MLVELHSKGPLLFCIRKAQTRPFNPMGCCADFCKFSCIIMPSSTVSNIVEYKLCSGSNLKGMRLSLFPSSVLSNRSSNNYFKHFEEKCFRTWSDCSGPALHFSFFSFALLVEAFNLKFRICSTLRAVARSWCEMSCYNIRSSISPRVTNIVAAWMNLSLPLIPIYPPRNGSGEGK